MARMTQGLKGVMHFTLIASDGRETFSEIDLDTIADAVIDAVDNELGGIEVDGIGTFSIQADDVPQLDKE